MNTIEIDDVLKKKPATKNVYKGVYAADTLPKRVEYPSFYIANTQPQDHSGEHWVAFFFSRDKSVECFDSLGQRPWRPWHDAFVKRNARRFIYTPFRLQSLTSDVCGQYCIVYGLNRIRGISLPAFLKRFSRKNQRRNDALVTQLFTRMTSAREQVGTGHASRGGATDILQCSCAPCLLV